MKTIKEMGSLKMKRFKRLTSNKSSTNSNDKQLFLKKKYIYNNPPKFKVKATQS